jgi:hypothetical protein
MCKHKKIKQTNAVLSGLMWCEDCKKYIMISETLKDVVKKMDKWQKSI